MPEPATLVLATFPDPELALSIARTLVEEKLAACVNLLPQVESIYRWKGAIETASETLALIKTTNWKYDLLEQRIRSLHPYEVPEIISLPIDTGHAAYLRWIEQSVIQ